MIDHLPAPLKAAAFYAISLLLTLTLALTPGVSTFVHMLTPLVAVLLVMLVITRQGRTRAGWRVLGLHRLGLRQWGTALLVPILVIGSAFLVLWLTGLASFAIPDEIEGFRTQGLFWLVFPFVLLLTLIINTLTNSLGEELGWRGFLLPHLLPAGPVRAMLLTGVLHALWHLPVMLLTPLYHAEGDRLIVVPLFIASVTAAGFFLGHLRLASGSVWPAALGHTAHNMMWAVGAYFTLPNSGLAVEYLAGDSGVLVALGYALVAVWVVARIRRHPAPDGRSQPQGTLHSIR